MMVSKVVILIYSSEPIAKKKTLLLLQPILGGYLILCIIDGFDFKKKIQIERISSFLLEVIRLQVRQFQL